ncbi:MAG: 1-phosphofructokinase [Deltaproteobacteria bacterium]|nr:MAG: 1-phosphofructokinase [Deltaproteobacteria bacterium]
MIYTITLNPALDRTIEVEGLLMDDANRILRESRFAGGKGIDASRVIKELGGESIALGFIGGYDGLELEGRLINEGILCDFTKISGETRINIVLCDRREKTTLMLNAAGPRITPAEVGLFFQKILSIPRDAEFVVVSGSVPPGVNYNVYAQIITTVKGMGIRVALDADGELLRQGYKANPSVIKPNIYEFQRLTGVKSNRVEDLLQEARGMAEGELETVLVSMGARGIMGVKRGEAYWAIPPQVEVVSAVGAGDSAVAGFIYALTKGMDFRESLALATAAGTAAVLTPGTQLCRREDVERIKGQIKVEAL